MSLDNRSRCGRRDPADTIIRLLGGDEAVAAVLGVSRGTVGKWTYGSRDGRDGEVPRPHREALIAEARRQGWDLQFEHFAWRPPGEPPPDIRRIEARGRCHPRRRRRASAHPTTRTTGRGSAR